MVSSETNRAEYEAYWRITDFMPVSGVGIVTARDALSIDLGKSELWARVVDFGSLSGEEARSKYDLGNDVQSWKAHLAQKDVKASGPSPDLIRQILYRPFDVRFIYYTGKSGGFVCRPVYEIMQHMVNNRNLALCTNRQVNGEFRHALCTTMPINDCTLSLATRERTYLFPLYLADDQQSEGKQTRLLEGTSGGQRPSLSPAFISELEKRLDLTFVPTKKSDSRKTLGPEDVFHYMYAVFYSPTYRSRYAEFLKIDFPRLPLTSNGSLFVALAGKGCELAALHLLESPKLNQPLTAYSGPTNPEVEKISYSRDTVWLDKAQTRDFRGVSEAVWEFHIGGYQVCEKWLKDRKGRTLLKDDIAHYRKIVVALSETIRLMTEIDKVIEGHGGWPDAFITSKN
jgi:hypothetical protein